MTWTGSYIVKLPKKTKLLKFYKILTDRESSHMQPSVFVHIVVFHHGVGGSNKILRSIRGAIRNYIWSGEEQLPHTQVSWK